MQLADRDEFIVQLKTLCAGYNIPCTPEREDAYWRGLERLHLSQFARVVSHALSERGPEKIPSVREVWNLQRVLRRAPETHADAPKQRDALAIDAYTAFANRRLLGFLASNGAATADSLEALIATKNRLARNFADFGIEEPVTEEEYAEALRKAWRREFRPVASELAAA